MKKTISILGSTGSIGLTTFKIIDKKKNFFKINILVANKNFSLISHQIRKYKPKVFVISNEKIFKKIKKKFNRNKKKILNTLKDINFQKSDCTISAIPGIDGLTPTLQMIKKAKNPYCKQRVNYLRMVFNKKRVTKIQNKNYSCRL